MVLRNSKHFYKKDGTMSRELEEGCGETMAVRSSNDIGSIKKHGPDSLFQGNKKAIF